MTTVPSNNPKIYGSSSPELSWQCLLLELYLSLELPFSLLMLSCEMCIPCSSASLVCGGLNEMSPHSQASESSGLNWIPLWVGVEGVALIRGLLQGFKKAFPVCPHLPLLLLVGEDVSPRL